MKSSVVCCFVILHCCFGQKNSEFVCTDGYTSIPSILLCSGTGNCPDCSDERNCTHNKQFMSCGFGPPFCYSEEQHCNGVIDCTNCRDERNCPNKPTTLFTCDNEQGCVDFFFGIDECIRLDRDFCPYFCDGIPHCSDGSDEKSEGFGFKCVTTDTGSANLRSSSCIIPQRYLGRRKSEPSICRNGADQCFVNNDTKVFNETMCWTCLDGTIIQRQQVCDKVFDCRDLSDECLCFRDNLDESICESFLNNTNCKGTQVSCPHENKCINVTQICDGKKDCENANDEQNCSRNKERNCGTSDGNKFLCEISRLVENQVPIACNGFPECLQAEDECQANCIGKRPEYCETLANRDAADELLSCGNLTNALISVQQLCNKIIDCPNAFDEKDCGGLIFCKSGNELVPYDQRECGIDRCNLEAVCDNIEDELNCSSNTHFYCDQNTRFIPQWLRFDGTFDCKDYSDECIFTNTSISSRTNLIGSALLRVVVWILMFLSLVGNGFVIFKTSIEIYQEMHKPLHCTESTIGDCNRIMILNLAFADFLMGVYLFIIAVKSVEFSGFYCVNQLQWITGNQCAAAGVLAVLSSQASVFLLVLMTSHRLFGVKRPFSAGRFKRRALCLTVLLIWIISFAIAIIPIIPSAHFVSGITINQPYTSSRYLTPNQLYYNLISVANRLPGVKQIEVLETAFDIYSFCSLFQQSASIPSYCHMPELLQNNYFVGYYGSNDVCLPRYFASVDEPVSAYSIGIVGLNFAAFVYIFIAYLYIYHSVSVKVKASQGIPITGISVNAERAKKSQALWGKIVRILVTDFLCWIPICIMAFMAFFGVQLPDIAYPITAIVLIPINSAANPWLYSTFFIENIKRIFR